MLCTFKFVSSTHEMVPNNFQLVIVQLDTVDIYIENCRSLASMLLCLMHILVSAEPMSLVPPETQKHNNMSEKHHTMSSSRAKT